jgi:hypothetical protein
VSKLQQKKHIEKNLSDKQTYWKKFNWWNKHSKKSLNDEQTYWKITHKNSSVKIAKKNILNFLKSDKQTYWKITHKNWSVKIAKKIILIFL